MFLFKDRNGLPNINNPNRNQSWEDNPCDACGAAVNLFIPSFSTASSSNQERHRSKGRLILWLAKLESDQNAEEDLDIGWDIATCRHLFSLRFMISMKASSNRNVLHLVKYVGGLGLGLLQRRTCYIITRGAQVKECISKCDLEWHSFTKSFLPWDRFLAAICRSCVQYRSVNSRHAVTIVCALRMKRVDCGEIMVVYLKPVQLYWKEVF